MRWMGALLLVLLAPLTASAAPKSLKLDTVHSKIGFTASTLLFDVDGRFRKFDIQVDGDPAKPTSAKVSVHIDAASIDTDNEKRDKHLRSPDFFDVKKYPSIRFVSDKVTASGDKLTVHGTLTMHGRKKRVSVPLRVVRGRNGAGMNTVAYKGTLKINRQDFGIGADSIAAKISMEDAVEVQLLIVTFP